MIDKVELLPCPFCGMAARLESNHDWHRIIVDHDEACIFLEPEVSMVPATDDQLSIVVADWNRRASLSQQLAPAAVPDGWKLVPLEPTKEILDEFDSIVDYGADDSADAWSRMLAASPAAPAPRNNHGVDAHYFHRKLSLVLRDFDSLTPDELARTLARLSKVADERVLAEREFAPAPAAQEPVAWIVVDEPFHGTSGVEAGEWDVEFERKAIDELATANSPGRIPLYTAPPAAEQPDTVPAILTDDDHAAVALRRAMERMKDGKP